MGYKLKVQNCTPWLVEMWQCVLSTWQLREFELAYKSVEFSVNRLGTAVCLSRDMSVSVMSSYVEHRETMLWSVWKLPQSQLVVSQIFSVSQSTIWKLALLSGRWKHSRLTQTRQDTSYNCSTESIHTATSFVWQVHNSIWWDKEVLSTSRIQTTTKRWCLLSNSIAQRWCTGKWYQTHTW